MSLDSWPVKVSSPEHYRWLVKFVGGSGAVTKVHGSGVTVTYISTGVVDLVWADSPGTFFGLMGFGFEATTQSGLKGFTLVAGVFNTSTNTLRLNITNASDALTDLAASQWLSLDLAFKRTQA